MNEVKTARYNRLVAQAQAELAAGFKSASAQKDAGSTVSYAFDILKDELRDPLLAIDLTDRAANWDDLYFDAIPYSLEHWRAKHAAALIAGLPALAPVCAKVDELVALRAAIKAAPVVKPETKKAATERKVAETREAVERGTASPIAMAIAPLRAEAMADAKTWATESAAQAKQILTAAGFDIDVAAPLAERGASKFAAAMAVERRAHLFQFLDCPKRDGRFKWSEEAAQKFIARRIAEAAASFDSFVTKLDRKVGIHTAATLAAGRTWGFSILHVTLADGTVEKWKTQSIVNRSALGLHFNQWPTRIVK